jgi:YfiH family protein
MRISTMLLRSDLVPAHFTHGFTTRAGGVSTGRFASLNTSYAWGDEPAAVRENLARIGEVAGFPAGALVTVKQVHGATVRRASALGGAHGVPSAQLPEADALIWVQGDPRVVLGVRTADCVPILLASRGGFACAAIHSGWRGTVLDVAGAAVRALEDLGVPADDLIAAIGPCISAAAFEVGEEVAAQFDEDVVVRAPPRRPHVDLAACVHRQLVGAGLSRGAIAIVGGCTFSEPERFFSYRRDGAGIGQHLSFIGPIG